MDYNQAGQHHADAYVPLAAGTADLRYLNGRPMGQSVGWWQLVYVDGRGTNGQLRLDHHEFVTANVNGVAQRMVFFRAGLGLQDITIPYGHVLLSECEPGTVPRPTISGDGRGTSAPLTGQRYHLRVTSMPPGAVYKAGHPGSMLQTYAWPQARWGDMNAPRTMPLCWSWVSVAGGGMVRGVLADNATVDTCKVAPVHSPMYDIDTGRQSGDVSARYVRAYGKYGWVLFAHRPTGNDWIYHAERTG